MRRIPRYEDDLWRQLEKFLFASGLANGRVSYTRHEGKTHNVTVQPANSRGGLEGFDDDFGIKNFCAKAQCEIDRILAPTIHRFGEGFIVMANGQLVEWKVLITIRPGKGDGAGWLMPLPT
jgi:hypothetical protein